MSRQKITKEVLLDIAFRARLAVSKEHYQDYVQSFEKIVHMLDQIASVEVCEFKGYTHDPIPCDQLRLDTPISDMDDHSMQSACTHYNPTTRIIEVPKVLNEGN